MIANRIKELRKAKGLTQRQLAEIAGTSQQQVQRIEGGSQAAKLDLAKRLAAALECPIGALFPDLNQTSSKATTLGLAASNDAQANEALDLDPATHTIQIGMIDGYVHEHIVGSAEASRIRYCLLEDDREGYLVFDTPSRRIAISYKFIRFARLLFDLHLIEGEGNPVETEGMEVRFHEDPKPLMIGIDADWKPDPDGDLQNLQNLFFTLESPYKDEPFHFIDEDGEDVILYQSSLASLSVPLSSVCWELLEAEMDGFDEDEGN